jgi:hypothetical protein
MSEDCDYMETGVFRQGLLQRYYSAFTQAHISQHLPVVNLEAASAPARLPVSNAGPGGGISGPARALRLWDLHKTLSSSARPSPPCSVGVQPELEEPRHRHAREGLGVLLRLPLLLLRGRQRRVLLQLTGTLSPGHCTSESAQGSAQRQDRTTG